MKTLINKVNEKLDEYLQIVYPEEIFKAMKYTLMLPGKRLRPVMCLETARILGADYKKALPAACAIEMLHVQSLIHDDLPCMDNDDYRRGKPSNHKVFGEANAVLAGDALLTFAPQIILKYTKNQELTLKILDEYFKYAGAYGVIAGQIVDIESEKSIKTISNPIKTLEYIHSHKTADLFRLAIRTGAIIGGADEQQLQEMTTFAEKLGIAFQISDDILDEISTFEEMGKTIGKDKNAEKLCAKYSDNHYVCLYRGSRALNEENKFIEIPEE